MLQVGDKVQVNLDADCPSAQRGMVFTIVDVFNRPKAKLVYVDVKSADLCDCFYEYELSYVQEDNVSDWGNDYAYMNENYLTDDYLSETMLPATTSFYEDWKERHSNNLTAIQRAYQEGVKDGIEKAYQTVMASKNFLKELENES